MQERILLCPVGTWGRFGGRVYDCNCVAQGSPLHAVKLGSSSSRPAVSSVLGVAGKLDFRMLLMLESLLLSGVKART